MLILENMRTVVSNPPPPSVLYAFINVDNFEQPLTPFFNQHPIMASCSVVCLIGLIYKNVTIQTVNRVRYPKNVYLISCYAQ